MPDDLVATITVQPGQSPAELAYTLAQLPDGLEFADAFGDRTIVMVYGTAGVPLSVEEMLAAVAASLGNWGTPRPSREATS
ncbi:hypothetical protein I6A84_16645 [Frankia sp. CNm7]|uniref:Uncharacterized protein n=1 Tax=Frankia nepalensis TaxID=1836974 RepID=A0A937RLY6_9ACTN|nr:hypothetical protein [Frankia nepalensis]MBL7501179.1 hypothetical protein [Frankia nepalensis]MBL7512619.1 hypothetical protein [Frankia nepalensis]MBL7519683.1 hypothetical protein [Frankia nepalensis]MBL7632675.1 hypothetical protein [Frankia nepalensis]